VRLYPNSNMRQTTKIYSDFKKSYPLAGYLPEKLFPLKTKILNPLS
jgi:hypothetical protein